MPNNSEDIRDWKLKNDFSSLGEVIESELSANPRYKFALKCATLFSFWSEIVGVKFAKFSKPLALNYNKLFVVCKNPVVVQELSMFNSDLLKKIEKYAAPLNLNVKELVFTYKNWNEVDGTPEMLEALEDKNFTEYSPSQLEEIELTQAELDGIFENINAMPFLSNELKEKYYNDIVNSIRAQKLRGVSIPTIL